MNDRKIGKKKEDIKVTEKENTRRKEESMKQRRGEK
jgi:hypothetical protein